MLIVLLAAAAASQAPVTAYPAPLAPAATGQAQCYGPSDHKTCRSLATYTANGDGTFANGASVMLSSQPLVLLDTTTQVSIKGQAVCGAIHRADVLAGKLSVNGTQLPAEQAKPLLTNIATALDKIIEHEICTTYVPNGTGLVAKATMDGVAQPDQDQAVIWVSPSDGYTVAP